jgi:hypothetical protein
MVLHDITVVKCGSGCLKIVLDAGLVMDVTLYSFCRAHSPDFNSVSLFLGGNT